MTGARACRCRAALFRALCCALPCSVVLCCALPCSPVLYSYGRDSRQVDRVAFYPELGKGGARRAKELAVKLSAEFADAELAAALEDRDALAGMLSAVGYDTRSAAQKRAASMMKRK